MKKSSLAIMLILLTTILSRLPMNAHLISSNAASIESIGKLAPPQVTIIEENETGTTLRIDFFGFHRSQTEVNGTFYDVLEIPSCGKTGNVGEPAIPQYATALEIPFEVDFEAYPLNVTSEDFTGYLVYPAQEPGLDAVIETYPPFPTPPFYINETFYQTFNASCPTMIVESEPAGILRDVRVLPLRFAAFQYNPVQRLLRFYWSITVRIDYFLGPMSQTSLKLPTETSRYFESFYSSLVNHKRLATETGPELEEFSDPVGCNYLIITDSTLRDAADRIAARRNAEGLLTTAVNTVDIPWAGVLLTPDDIKAYIQTAYDTWNPRPSYLLLLGDAELIPTFYQTVHSDAGGLYPAGFRTGTDLYYAILNGPDAPPHFSEYWTPDIFYGRIPVDTLGQANAVVDKIFKYEDSQWISGEKTALVSGYFQDGTDGLGLNGYEDRRFILTCEEIRDFLQGEGFDVERLYCTDPIVNPTHYNNGIFDAGASLPTDLLRPTYAWDADAVDITNAINDGRFFVFHRDHGGSLNRPSSPVEGWGDPEYEATDVPALNNNDHYTVVFSINCETGWFDGETDGYATRSFESLCEAFLRESDGGAVGVFGATRISSSGWNDDLAKGFVDAIWPNFDTAHGPATAQMTMGEVLNYGRWYMYTIGGWSGLDIPPAVARKQQYEIFHYFGDPTMSFKIPTNVVHDVAVTDVTASPANVVAGNPVSVGVDVLNEGTVDETFTLDAYYDATLIGTASVTLSSGASTTVTFTWDTTSVPLGTYVIKAAVPPVTGETHIADNEFIDGRVTIIGRAHVDIHPETLNLNSKGIPITCFVSLPEGYDVNDINVATILLNNTLPAFPKPVSTGDLHLMVQFDRAKTQQLIISKGIRRGDIALTVTLQLYDGTMFEGTDTVRVIMIARDMIRFWDSSSAS